MSEPDQAPTDKEQKAPDPLEGCTRLAVVVWGAIVAPIAAGLAIGSAVVVGSEVVLTEAGMNIPLAYGS